MQTIIIVLIIAAAAAGAAYFIARHLKGSLTIQMDRADFSHGELVRGAFELVARKEIRGNNLTAALVGTEHWHEHDSKGRSHQHSREIYRSGQTLESAKVYPAGHTARYEFQLQVPSERPAVTGGSMLGQVLETGLNLLSGRRNVSWKVEVRLDAEGVDLADSKKIRVGGSDSMFGL